MAVNDIVTINLILDTCWITGATKLIIVGAPHQRNIPNRVEAFGLSTYRGASGTNGSIPTILDKINVYAMYSTGSTINVFLELEPVQTNTNCATTGLHKYYLESEDVKGTFVPSTTVAFNRPTAVLVPVRLLGRTANGQHPWSPAPSCQALYEDQSITQSGWYYIYSPTRSTASYRPAQYVLCNVTSTTPIAVQAWGYSRYVSPRATPWSAVGARQQCSSAGGDLASFSNQDQYETMVAELQTPLRGAGNPHIRWWIGLQHIQGQNWGPNTNFWNFTNGAPDYNVAQLWETNMPGNTNGCVAARLTIGGGASRGTGLNTWTPPDSLSLSTSSCTVPPAPNALIMGTMCFGPLPSYAN
jgi:hypothetical protein